MRYIIVCLLFPILCYGERFVVHDSHYNTITEKVSVIIDDTEVMRRYVYYIDFEGAFQECDLMEFIKEPKKCVEKELIDFIFWNIPFYAEPINKIPVPGIDKYHDYSN